MKAKEVKKIIGITQPTLQKYVRTGLIRVTKINKNHYVYNEEDVYKLIGLKKKNRQTKHNVSYSRVSTHKQKGQLKEQTNRIYGYCICKGIDLEVQYEDIKSGINFEREQFNLLIEEVLKGKVELVIIENKDRLTRFGFKLIENVFKYFGTRILVINDKIENKSYNQELTEDLVSIIHHFSMKMFSYKRKLNKIKNEMLNNK